MKGAEPIFLPGRKRIGVLLYHGWSSSPQEFNPTYTDSTVKHLQKLGYTVYVPLSRGHGTQPDDLRGIKWENWLADARQHYDEFSKEVKRLVVGGMSMGANIALTIAAERPVAGVMSMGTPIFYRAHPLFVLWVWLWRRSQKLKTKRYWEPDKNIALKKVHYIQYPPESVHQTVRSGPWAKKLLTRIKA
ncbi:MAG: hypothetical protein A2Y84_01525, partial [Candidatus Colwellbacteria bacterium RBG_13_48_8]